MQPRPDRVDPAGRATGEATRIGIGAALANLRRRRGLTGHELGRLAGMSQAKISKIETGAVVPTPRDVQRLAGLLGAPDDVVADLTEQAEGLHARFVDWRVTSQRLTAGQQIVATNEERARTIRVFQPAVVPGLLQTAEYARAVITDYATVFAGVGVPQQDVPPAVSLRIRRQEALYDRSKRFVFVVTESVLRNRVCAPAAMLAQLDRLRSVAALENVTVGVVPSAARLAYPPLHGFQMFDDRAVVVDMINTSVASRGKADLRAYRTVFDYYLRVAETDLGPFLDRYTRLYADLAASDAD